MICTLRNDAMRIMWLQCTVLIVGAAVGIFGKANPHEQSSPGQPLNLTAVVSGNTVTLTWTAPVSGDAPTSYIIEAGSAPGLNDRANLDTGTPVTFASGSAPTGSYFVRVRGRNDAGVGPSSNEVRVDAGFPPGSPGPPGGLTAAVTGNAVALAWAGPASGGAPTSYVIEAGSAPGASDLATVDTGSAATAVAGSAPGGHYFVRVRGRNAAGVGPSSNEILVQVCLPGVPGGIQASVAGTRVTLGWSAGAGCPAADYIIDVGTTPGVANLGTFSTLSPVRQITANVPPGRYFVRLRARNAFGTSAASRDAMIPVAVPCPGAIVGNPSDAPTISIVGLQPGDGRIIGVARNLDARVTRVVIWAKTDQWYVQPFIATPYTSVCSDGWWTNTTHPWTRMVALVVDQSYVPGSIRQTHPSGDPGVVAWDEYPTRTADRVVEFSGRRWKVKNADLAGPGPNYFSDSESNLRVAADGLHLRIEQRDGRWYCAEVFAEQSLGYGSYTFHVTIPQPLDFQTVFGAFTYESAAREIDVEMSEVLATPNNAQYVIQPYTRAGNMLRFNVSPSGDLSHRFVWRSDRIEFASWTGHEPEPRPETLVRSWTYLGPDIPPPGGERMRFNLWLFDGRAPLSGRGDEVIVRAFRFEP